MGFDFLALDFETACSKLNSACSFGIVCVKDLEIVDSAYSLIRPPEMSFDPHNSSVHGITPDMVEAAPTLSEYWPQVSSMFSPHTPVVAHNAHFDMSVLRLSMDGDPPDFPYVDSISMVTPFVDGSHSLEHCSDVLGIDMGNHHNALDDAATCAKIAIFAIKEARCVSMWEYLARRQFIPLHDFSDLKPQQFVGHTASKRKKFESIKVTEIVPASYAAMDLSHPLYGKSIVFTGELSIGRREAMQQAADVGAVIRNSVSAKTDYLVVGTQDLALVGNDGMSTKQEQASALNESGKGHISILTEAEFFALMKWGAVEL